MRIPLLLVAAALSMALISSEAFGMAWGDSRHRRGTGPSGGAGEGSEGSGYNAGLPEPSSLHAIASGLILLGGAGWLLRRK